MIRVPVHHSYYELMRSCGSPISVTLNTPCNNPTIKPQFLKKKQINLKQSVTLKPISKVVIHKTTKNCAKKQCSRSVAVKRISKGSGKSHGDLTDVTSVQANKNTISYSVPPYPIAALMKGLEGTVVIRLLIIPEGKIIKRIIYKSSGHKILDESVLNASANWTVNTKPPQPMWIEIFINFKIKTGGIN